MSAAWHRAGEQQLCAGCYSTKKDTVRGRKSSSRLAAETPDTREKLEVKPDRSCELGWKRPYLKKTRSTEQDSYGAAQPVFGGEVFFSGRPARR